MTGKMKVAVMTALRKIEYEERNIPTPKENEVLVKLEYVGICGSDMHYYEIGSIGDCIATPPFVLGHEPSGTVVEVGADVENLKIGDRVALEPGRTCGKCEFCKSGRYNLCPDVSFFAAPPIDGVFQEYAVHEASLCHKLPPELDTMEGALIEPLAIGFYAASRGKAHIGQAAVVFGTGCIGLVSMLALKAQGISPIIIVDVIEKRLEKAKELGADYTINSTTENVVSRILEITNNLGADLAIETAGTEITTNQAIHAVKKGSNIVLIGYTKTGKVNMEMSTALDKELTFRTIYRSRHMFDTAIEAVRSGKVNLKGIVTNVFDFNDMQTAMDLSCDQKASIVKAVVKI